MANMSYEGSGRPGPPVVLRGWVEDETDVLTGDHAPMVQGWVADDLDVAPQPQPMANRKGSSGSKRGSRGSIGIVNPDGAPEPRKIKSGWMDAADSQPQRKDNIDEQKEMPYTPMSKSGWVSSTGPSALAEGQDEVDGGYSLTNIVEEGNQEAAAKPVKERRGSIFQRAFGKGKSKDKDKSSSKLRRYSLAADVKLLPDHTGIPVAPLPIPTNTPVTINPRTKELIELKLERLEKNTTHYVKRDSDKLNPDVFVEGVPFNPRRHSMAVGEVLRKTSPKKGRTPPVLRKAGHRSPREEMAGVDLEHPPEVHPIVSPDLRASSMDMGDMVSDGAVQRGLRAVHNSAWSLAAGLEDEAEDIVVSYKTRVKRSQSVDMIQSFTASSDEDNTAGEHQSDKNKKRRGSLFGKVFRGSKKDKKLKELESKLPEERKQSGDWAIAYQDGQDNRAKVMNIYEPFQPNQNSTPPVKLREKTYIRKASVDVGEHHMPGCTKDSIEDLSDNVMTLSVLDSNQNYQAIDNNGQTDTMDGNISPGFCKTSQEKILLPMTSFDRSVFETELAPIPVSTHANINSPIPTINVEDSDEENIEADPPTPPSPSVDEDARKSSVSSRRSSIASAMEGLMSSLKPKKGSASGSPTSMSSRRKSSSTSIENLTVSHKKRNSGSDSSPSRDKSSFSGSNDEESPEEKRKKNKKKKHKASKKDNIMAMALNITADANDDVFLDSEPDKTVNINPEGGLQNKIENGPAQRNKTHDAFPNKSDEAKPTKVKRKRLKSITNLFKGKDKNPGAIEIDNYEYGDNPSYSEQNAPYSEKVLNNDADVPASPVMNNLMMDLAESRSKTGHLLTRDRRLSCPVISGNGLTLPTSGRRSSVSDLPLVLEEFDVDKENDSDTETFTSDIRPHQTVVYHQSNEGQDGEYCDTDEISFDDEVANKLQICHTSTLSEYDDLVSEMNINAGCSCSDTSTATGTSSTVSDNSEDQSQLIHDNQAPQPVLKPQFPVRSKPPLPKNQELIRVSPLPLSESLSGSDTSLDLSNTSELPFDTNLATWIEHIFSKNGGWS